MTQVVELAGDFYVLTGKELEHLAATATETRAIWTAPCNCVITGCSVVNPAAVTGNDTNSTNLNLLDAGAAGTGTTEIGNLDLATGTNLVANVPSALTVTATVLTAGDVVKVQYEKVGTGLLLTAEHFFQITYRRV
jgi:hypothetical protein